ncbi:MAG TPA: FtsQ-type POTRA domain-containing protein [Candidatus Eisenbacteria bacterium]|nr:FtsQ-type POTRA domain-containing protein [Candidatus Eisenbacteria bacterium]
MKAITRSASGAAEADSYRPELLADDEPRYLRRQKPVEIRRKKFSGRGWPFYRRVLVLSVGGVVGATAAYYGAQFLLYSPSMLLLKPDQIEVNGNRIVTREAVLQQFVHDRNRSVLQVPLEARRSQLEQIPWVESASVQRILPNRLRVELTERTPVAFARSGNELALIDAHGVILDRPRGEELHFPIVTGVSEDLPRDQREKRMQTYAEFMKDVDLVRSGSSDRVSEVDLSIPKDLRVVMTGLANANDSQAVTIHFGSSEFTGKFKMLVDNFSQWQANAGHVQSIDLQYSRQVVVNPDTSSGVTTARKK